MPVVGQLLRPVPAGCPSGPSSKCCCCCYSWACMYIHFHFWGPGRCGRAASLSIGVLSIEVLLRLASADLLLQLSSFHSAILPSDSPYRSSQLPTTRRTPSSHHPTPPLQWTTSTVCALPYSIRSVLIDLSTAGNHVRHRPDRQVTFIYRQQFTTGWEAVQGERVRVRNAVQLISRWYAFRLAAEEARREQKTESGPFAVRKSTLASNAPVKEKVRRAFFTFIVTLLPTFF